MKIINYILLLLTISSCSNSFLDISSETTLNEGNFLKSQTEFVLLANGCYMPMRNAEKETHWVLAEIPSDNSTYQYNPTDGGAWSRSVFDQFVAASSNSIITTFWNMNYKGVTDCNRLLYELDRTQIRWEDEAYKERCYGEAYFLRALYYFNMVRQWGGVPLVLTPISGSEAVNIKRAPAEKVYEQIVDDLTKSATNFAEAVSVDETGRANYAAAMGMLGKVLLTLHRYKEAATALKSVIDMNKYILLPNYADLFNPASKDFKETIFAIQYSENSVELACRFIFIFAPWTSEGDVTKRPNIKINGTWSGWNQPTDDLVKAFSPEDLRKDASIGFWVGKDWDGEVRTIPYCNKYKSPVSAPDDRCSDNLPILRYSDILLMYAEALNELGQGGTAVNYLNLVRTRAGLQPLNTVDKASLSASIAKERQLEFCFENQRYYDLKRTGKAIEVLSAHGAREKAAKAYMMYQDAYNITQEKLLCPIPAEQISVNKLEQNPGW